MKDALDEAEAAGRFQIPVEAHDDTLDLTDAREELVDLLFGREETVKGKTPGFESARFARTWRRKGRTSGFLRRRSN